MKPKINIIDLRLLERSLYAPIFTNVKIARNYIIFWWKCGKSRSQIWHCDQAIVRQLSGSGQAVVRKLSCSCQALVRHLSGACQAVVRQLSSSCQAVIRQSLGICQAVVRQLSGSRQAVVRQLSGSRQEVIKNCFAFVLKNVLNLPCSRSLEKLCLALFP